jgi:hypothetical protein
MITFTFFYLKPVALLLSIVVLFQCCTDYYKEPVTIEQAMDINHRKSNHIKIEFIDGSEIIYDSIYYKDNNLYGLAFGSKKEKVIKTKRVKYAKDRYYIDSYTTYEKPKIEVKVDEDKISKIYLHNRGGSSEGTALIVLGSIGLAVGILGIWFIINFNRNFHL